MSGGTMNNNGVAVNHDAPSFAGRQVLHDGLTEPAGHRYCEYRRIGVDDNHLRFVVIAVSVASGVSVVSGVGHLSHQYMWMPTT